MRLTLDIRQPCPICGFAMPDTEELDRRRTDVALFGATEEVCATCYSTPDDRDGQPLAEAIAEARGR